MKATPERLEKLATMLADGHWRTAACAAAGIDDKTLRNWIKSDEEGKAGYEGIASLIRAAETKAESVSLKIIRTAETPQETDDWKAHAWWLQRRFPDRYGDKSHHVVETHQPDDAKDPRQVMADLFASPAARGAVDAKTNGKGKTNGAGPNEPSPGPNGSGNGSA